MRVCMLVKNSFEFDARVTREARSLIAAGHDVAVIALHVPGVTEPFELRDDGIYVIRVPRIYGRLRSVLPSFLRASTTTPGGATAGSAPVAPAPGSGARQRSVPRPLRRLLRRLLRTVAWPLQRVNDIVVGRRMRRTGLSTGPDVVHAHDLNTLAIGVHVAARANAALVYDAHELHTARNDATPWGRRLARIREQWGVHRADAVITATDTWADLMASAYATTRPAVVRNVPPPIRVAEPVDLRARLGLKPDHTVVLYQGSIQTNRGIEPMLTALPDLARCVFVVCGYGAHRPVLEERVAATDLHDRVRFDGPVPNDQLIAYTAGADIGLCLIVGSSLSYRTSLPNKLFEYLMAGIPVVASDFPEMGAVVRETDAGEVCDPTDPSAIAAAIERLRRPERYAAARANARRAAADLHWGNEQQRLLEVYAGLGA